MTGRFNLGINYCDGDTFMARCVARDHSEQRWCDGYMQHSFADRCTHCNEVLGRTCDNWKQAEAFNQIGIVRIDDIKEDMIAF